LRIAITRALPDAEDTARAIRTRGGEALIAPLLTTIPRAFDTDVEGAQALIFTSTTGARAFPDASRARATPVITVGDASAAAARAAGFVNVRSADGDAATLAALIIATLDPSGGALIHIRGEHVAGDVAGQLAAAGFRVDQRLAYSAVQAETLPPALAEPLDVVLLYSARAAAALRALGAPDAASRTAACLSAGVAQAAGPGWGRVIVATRPREDALLDAIFAP
jgi:uroporphyrinogen-III synthase